MDNNLLKLVYNILPKWFLPLQSNLLENSYSSKTTFQTIFWNHHSETTTQSLGRISTNETIKELVLLGTQ